ncbi:MAG: hypothetical protein Q8K70_10400 [Bacteroidota bacterium]|nr:hypothetical protein [Bacteroidota bacterium]
MKNNIILVVLCFPFWNLTITAQNNTSSPYSARGFGEFEQFNGVYNRSLGGVINGIRSKRTVSLSNPASLGAITQVSFEFAFRGDYSTVYNASAKNQSFNGNFNYFSLAFPVYRKQEITKDTVNKTKLYKNYHTIWSSGIGLIPFSNVNTSYFRTKDTSYGRISSVYSLTGGLNRLYWMNAVNINKSISVGLNSSYIFGQRRVQNTYFIDDSLQSRGTFDDQSYRFSGFLFNLGTQIERNIDTIVRHKKDSIGKIISTRKIPIRFIWGASIHNEGNINYSLSRLTLNKSLISSTYRDDTIINQETTRRKTNIPLSFSAGMSVTINNKWMLAFDYQASMLSKMDKQLFNDSFTNSSQINIGFAYRPDRDVEYLEKNFGKRKRMNLEYRFGFRYLNSGFNFRDNLGNILPMKEYGISFGIGIPKLKEYWDGKKVILKSMVNLTGEYVMRGSTNNGLIAENLVRLTIGFTISDIWFTRKKFN